MDKATRNNPLSIHQKLRNKRIFRKKSPGERQYGVIKNIFHNAHLKVTKRPRIGVKICSHVFLTTYNNYTP